MGNSWEKDEIEVDLKGIFILLLKKSLIIISVALCIALLTYIYGKEYSVGLYTSCTKVYVLSKQNQEYITYSDVQLGAQISEDYDVIIKARPVMEEVIKRLKISRSSEQLVNQIKVIKPEDTRILMIYVTDVNPILAMQIADTVREVASEYIKNVINIETLNVIETANLPTNKNGTTIVRDTLISGFLGALIVIAIYIVRFQLDDSVKSPENIEQKLGLSVLASIPLNSKRKVNRRNNKVDKIEMKKKILNDSNEINDDRLAL